MQKLEEKLLLQSEEIFEKALFYSNGDPASALERVFLTTLWIAKKYKGLANKDRALDLFYERLASQSVKKSERAGDVKTAISEAFALYRRNRKRKSILSLCLLTVVLLAAIYPIARYCIVPALNSDENPSYTTQTDAEGNVIQPIIGSVTMKKTDSIKSDNGKITLENYHNLSDWIKEKSETDVPSDTATLLERFCDSVTAPDGTTYMVYNSVEKADGSNTIFTLYRMEKDGWKPLGMGEAQSNYGAILIEQYYASRIYVIADSHSDIYVFVILDNSVVVYKYEAKTGDFFKSDAKLSSVSPISSQSFSTYYDESTGDERIYVAYKNIHRFSFAYYDIAKDEFVSVTENIGSSMNDAIVFCVKNETIYAVVQGTDSTTSKSFLTYYQIGFGGVVLKKSIFTSEDSWMTDREYIYNRGSGSGGIAVDESGVVHIISSYIKTGMNSDSQAYLVHYMINPEGDIEKQKLPKQYYQDHTNSNGDTRYEPVCVSFFVGEHGEIYYMEFYDATRNLLVLCELDRDECGKSEQIDVIELLDNIYACAVRFNNNSMVFYSDSKDIFYFEFNVTNK